MVQMSCFWWFGLGSCFYSRIENFSEKQERSYPLNNERQLEKERDVSKFEVIIKTIRALQQDNSRITFDTSLY